MKRRSSPDGLEPAEMDRRAHRSVWVAGLAAGALLVGAGFVGTGFLVPGSVPFAVLLALIASMLIIQWRIAALTRPTPGRWYARAGKTRLDGLPIVPALALAQWVLFGLCLAWSVWAWQWKTVGLLSLIVAVLGPVLIVQGRLAWFSWRRTLLPALRLSPTELTVVSPGQPRWTTTWDEFRAASYSTRGIYLITELRVLDPLLRAIPLNYSTLDRLLRYYKEHPDDRHELGDHRAAARIAAWEAEDEAAAA